MFKKLKTTCIVTAVALATILPGQASASASGSKGIQIKNNVSITVNGETLNVYDPILNKSDFLLLPMRALYEAVGASVSWDKETLTASAYRNGKTVDLTIDSMKALVDGQEIGMDVAPFMYKDRTYMPLRFVSENFDGIVNWDEATQSVDITLSDDQPVEQPQRPQEDPYILHINNKRIVMKDSIVTKEGRTYLPASYIHDYLDGSTGTWLPDGSYELQIGGTSFIFTDNSNQALINNEAVTMAEKPFIQKGKMYVPAKFLVDALGGNLRYITEKKEMYIYVYSYMYTSPFLEKSYGSTSFPTAVPSAQIEGDRDLLISDNPETLKRKFVPLNNATLAQYEVKSTSTTNKHRIFGWHYNQLGTDVKLGITVQNTSSADSIRIEDSRGTSQKTGNSWVGHDIGLTIADVVLNDRLTKSESSGIVIAPGETKVIETYDLHLDYIIGFIHDLDIQSVNGGKPEYTIRTVLTKDNSDLASIKTEQVAIDEYAKHPRGVWPSAAIKAELPAYTVDSPEVGYNISNGSTDHLQTAENSKSTVNGAVGNPGHFGVNYKVDIPIDNPTGTNKTIKLKLAGRGGLYSGAIKVNGEVYLVPSLRVGAEYVELPDIKVNGTKDKIELEIMHAGGVNLPVAIYVETK
ncbi:copper amine oxidase N-terminal domain-containing protein [Lysinibacillus sp. FSL K6-0232]|uniref:copper amine oxidase N-terminal domain-containing protein n=1 Tax=unclassified Lysinibacillus TaxID=2636778 RepID=UPI0030F9D2E5